MTTESTALRRRYLAIAFLVGFSSLVYEVYSAKVLFLYFVQSVHAVAVTLSAFLAGLAASSLLCARFVAEDRRSAERALVVLQLAAAAYAVLVLRAYSLIPSGVDLAHRVFGAGAVTDFLRVAFSWLYLFLPGLFIGGAFPLLTGLYASRAESRTRDTGLVYFWDTFGAVAGALAAGFALLPWLGLRGTVLVPVALNLLVVALLASSRPVRALSAALGLASMAWAVRTDPAGRNPTPPGLAGGAASPSPSASPLAGFGRILAREESPFGTVTVADDARGLVGNRGLFIGQRDMCHTRSHGSESLLADNTVAQLQPGARVLNIGLGCGIVAGAIGASPQVGALDIAEINPVVARFAREYFAEPSRHVLELDKTRLFIEDGAEIVRRGERVYDAVVIDVEEPTVIHSSPLYTREYFELIRKQLAPGGVLSLWVIGSEPAYGRIIWNTLGAVFPIVEIRVGSGNANFNFYASTRPLHLSPLDADTSERVKRMQAEPLLDVNTIDNRALERHFNIRRAFALPRGYDEPVFSDIERSRAQPAGR